MKNTSALPSSIRTSLVAPAAALLAAFAALGVSAQTNVSTLTPTSGLLSLTGTANSTNYNLDTNFTVNVTTADTRCLVTYPAPAETSPKPARTTCS
jgi:hypothetical protein